MDLYETIINNKTGDEVIRWLTLTISSVQIVVEI
jgi:hypothetical protein